MAPRAVIAGMVGLLGLCTFGCAHSEDEWQAKLREASDLKAQLDRAEAQHGTSRKALEDEGAKLAGLERDLRAAGVDPANIATSVELQARAMEEHRRRAEHLEATKRRLALLREKLGSLTKDGLAVVVRHNRVVIQLPGDVIFEAGREALKPGGKEMLTKIAEVIHGDKSLAARSWQVAGHVESGKPGGAFKDGWGLSVMRAREVRALLVQPASKGGGLSGGRVSVAGYGDADPIDPGDSAGARKANQRCEIVALPSVDEALELTDPGR